MGSGIDGRIEGRKEGGIERRDRRKDRWSGEGSPRKARTMCHFNLATFIAHIYIYIYLTADAPKEHNT